MQNSSLGRKKNSRNMRTIHVLRSAKTNWNSLNTIGPLLEQIYKNWESETIQVRIHLFNKRNARRVLNSILADLYGSTHEIHIVSIDHYMPYVNMANWSAVLDSTRVFFHFHLYGDIIHRTDELLKIKKRLAGFAVNFFVPSMPLKLFLCQFFLLEQVHIIFFPIREVFGQGAFLRKNKQLRIAYVGRWNVDKGVADLLRWWDRATRAGEFTQATLFVVGAASGDRKYSMLPKNLWSKKLKIIRSFLVRPPARCRFVHSLTARQLANFLRSIDYLVSFSTFPLEEFGLAAAEGAASGTGLLLSRWAGHTAFAKAPNVSFLPITGGQIPEVVIRGKLQKQLYTLQPISKKQRAMQRAWAKKNVSMSAVSSRLHKFFYITKTMPKLSRKDNDYRFDGREWLELCANAPT